MSRVNDHELYLVERVLAAYSLENLHETYAGWMQAVVRNLRPDDLSVDPMFTLGKVRALNAAYASRQVELLDQRSWMIQARGEWFDEQRARWAA